MSYAVLFAGQGGQHPQMMPWLTAQASQSNALAAMEKSLGHEWRTILNDEALRGKNQFAQTLITGTSLATWEALKNHLNCAPAVVAGYSVGELAAFACAGVLSFAQAIELAVVRADLMDKAAMGQACGLLSVTGLPVHQVVQQHPALKCAIQIDWDQALFGAPIHELDLAQHQLVNQGVKCKRLNIEVASHTHHMASAAAAYSEHLKRQDMHPATSAIVLNASAKVCRRVNELRPALSEQLCKTIDWASCMDTVAEMGVSCVLEVSPDSALSTMWNHRHPAIAARSVQEFRNPEGAANWIARHVG